MGIIVIARREEFRMGSRERGPSTSIRLEVGISDDVPDDGLVQHLVAVYLGNGRLHHEMSTRHALVEIETYSREHRAGVRKGQSG